MQDFPVKSISQFKQHFRKLIIEIVQKILDKSQLALPVFTNSTAFHPQQIISIPKDSLKTKMKTLLHHPASLKIISNTRFKKAFLQHKKELYSKVKKKLVFLIERKTLDEPFLKPKFLIAICNPVYDQVDFRSEFQPGKC